MVGFLFFEPRLEMLGCFQIANLLSLFDKMISRLSLRYENVGSLRYCETTSKIFLLIEIDF